MDDQLIQSVKELKDTGLSERKIAGQLGVSRSRVHDALQKIKQAEQTKDLVPADTIRSIIREELERARDEGWEHNRRVRVGSADWRKTLVPSVEAIYGKGSMDADKRGDTLNKLFSSYGRTEDVPQQPQKNDKHINQATGLPYNTIRIAEVFDSAESCYDARVALFGAEGERVATLSGEDANKVYELAATLLEAGVSSTDVTSTVARKLSFSEGQVESLVNELIDEEEVPY